MTKAILQIIEAEYSYSEATIDSLCDKYGCTTKELKGYTTWRKNYLEPTKTKNKKQTDGYVKLVYETLYSPDITHEEDQLQTSIGLEANIGPLEVEAELVDDSLLTDDRFDRDIIHQTADRILHRQPVTKLELPQKLQDGFEGLRKLDSRLQEQSLRFLDAIELMLVEIETPKDLRDLAAVHTSIRDVYFNTKSPMINILNGDVNYGAKSELATLLEGAADDC